jgi:hypothetical protein
MNLHRTMPRSENGDRLAIRELVQAYAHCADRRDAVTQMALFTADTHLTQELHERESLALGVCRALVSLPSRRRC